MQNNESLVTPFFKTVPVHDETASKKAGRPIFRDVAHVEVRISGDRNFRPVFHAHAFWRRVDGEEITYAERWPKQYAAFLASQDQIADGTPLSELTFLTESKRMELRAMHVYSAEALASLDGKNLAALGLGGRVLKKQAEAYLMRSAGSAETTALAEMVENLKAQVAMLSAGKVPDEVDDPDEAGVTKAALKEQVRELTGALPRGNPSVETLQRMVDEALAA